MLLLSVMGLVASNPGQFCQTLRLFMITVYVYNFTLCLNCRIPLYICCHGILHKLPAPGFSCIPVHQPSTPSPVMGLAWAVSWGPGGTTSKASQGAATHEPNAIHHHPVLRSTTTHCSTLQPSHPTNQTFPTLQIHRHLSATLNNAFPLSTTILSTTIFYRTPLQKLWQLSTTLHNHRFLTTTLHGTLFNNIAPVAKRTAWVVNLEPCRRVQLVFWSGDPCSDPIPLEHQFVLSIG